MASQNKEGQERGEWSGGGYFDAIHVVVCVTTLGVRLFEHQFEGPDIAELPRLAAWVQSPAHLHKGPVFHVGSVSLLILLGRQIGASPHQIVTVRGEQAEYNFTGTFSIRPHFAIQPFNGGREDILKVLLLGAKLAAHFFNSRKIIMLDSDD